MFVKVPELVSLSQSRVKSLNIQQFRLFDWLNLLDPLLYHLFELHNVKETIKWLGSFPMIKLNPQNRE